MATIKKNKYNIAIHDKCAYCGKRLDVSISSDKEIVNPDLMLITEGVGFTYYTDNKLVCRDCLAMLKNQKAVTV